MKTREELLDRYENEPTASKFSKSDKVLHFTPKELKEVLSALTKKQLACPYCHCDADLNDTANSSFQLNLDMEDEHDPRLAVTYEDEFRDYDSVPISYCPCCGRKLGDE